MIISFFHTRLLGTLFGHFSSIVTIRFLIGYHVSGDTSGMASRKELFNFPGSKSRSIAWKHFGFQKQSDGPVSKSTLDMTRVNCRHCFKMYVFDGK